MESLESRTVNLVNILVCFAGTLKTNAFVILVDKYEFMSTFLLSPPPISLPHPNWFFKKKVRAATGVTCPVSLLSLRDQQGSEKSAYMLNENARG